MTDGIDGYLNEGVAQPVVEPEVDPYWSERAPAPPPKQAPTPEAAETAIAAKLDDPDFAKRYYGEYEPGHSDAVQQMAGLYALAHPGDGPAVIEPPQVEPTTHRVEGDDELPVKEQAEGELQDEADQERRSEALQQLLGDRVDERVGTARAWLGDEMTAAVNATGFGNDPQAVAEMVDLAERDPEGLMRATVHEMLGKRIYHGSATLERKRLEADQDFLDAYTQGHHPGHAEAMAKMQALHLLERPPKWAFAALEKLHART